MIMTFFILATVGCFLACVAVVVLDVWDLTRKRARISELKVRYWQSVRDAVARERNSMRADWDGSSKLAGELEQQRRRVAEAVKEERAAFWKAAADIEEAPDTHFAIAKNKFSVFLDEFIEEYGSTNG